MFTVEVENKYNRTGNRRSGCNRLFGPLKKEFIDRRREAKRASCLPHGNGPANNPPTMSKIREDDQPAFPPPVLH